MAINYADLLPPASPQPTTSTRTGISYDDLLPPEARKKRAAQQKTVEVAKGRDKKPKQENPLRTIGDVLEVGMAVPNAASRDTYDDERKRRAIDALLHGRFGEAAANAVGPGVRDALGRLGHGDFRGIADEYGAGTQHQLQFGAQRGDRLAQSRLDNPLVNTVATFGEEWVNPVSNLAGAGVGTLIGKGAVAAGRGIGAARRASPVIDDAAAAWQGAAADVARPFRAASAAARGAASKAVSAIPGVQAARGVFSRYAGLRDRGGTPYVAGGLAVQTAPARAEVDVANDTRARWGGLTSEQKREVQKLSYVDENGQRIAQRNAAVPDPRKGPSLEQRARDVRADFQRDDAEQIPLGIRDPEKGQLQASGLYFPMRRFGSRPVYATPELDAVAATNEERALRSIGRGRATFSAGVTQPGHKRYPTILEPEVEAKLHPEYDPAVQYQQHRLETRRAIENENARRGLESLVGVDAQGKPLTVTRGGVEVPQTARTPAHYVASPPSSGNEISLGFGEEGRAARDRYVHQLSSLMGRQAARQDPAVLDAAAQRGIAPEALGTRKVTARDPRFAEAKVQQARSSLAGVDAATAKAATTAARTAGYANRAFTTQVKAAANTLDKAQRSLLLGQDAIGTGLRASRAVVDALASAVPAERETAKALLGDLQRAKVNPPPEPVPPMSKTEQTAATVSGAQGMHAAEVEAQRPYWDALAQVGGKIKADQVWNPGKKRWELAGEFIEIPKGLLAPLKATVKGTATTGRAAGNIDQITAIVRKSHPEITDDEVRAFFAEHPRQPRPADFMAEARARVAQEVLARANEGGGKTVQQIRDELRAALDRVERSQGAVEGARTAAQPLNVAAVKAQGQGALASAGISEATAALRPQRFTTSQGSVYTVHPDGTTTRVQAATDTTHPQSEQTFFVTDPKVAQAIMTHADSHRITFPDGIPREGTFQVDPATGKAYSLTLNRVTGEVLNRQEIAGVSLKPAVGAQPVELWNDGSRVHVGHPVTEIGNDIVPPLDPKVFSQQVTGPLRTLSGKQNARIDDLREQVAKARSSSEMQAIWRAVFGEHYAKVKPTVEKTVEARAPQGYVRETDLGLASPSGREMALDQSFADFIKAGHGDHALLENPDAKGFWRTMNALNRISRASIVLLPMVHGINNLGMAYLATNGDVRTMTRILAGRYTPKADVLERARRAGAVNEFATGAFGGARDAHTLTADAGELSDEIAGRLGRSAPQPATAPRTGSFNFQATPTSRSTISVHIGGTQAQPGKLGPFARIAKPVVRAGIEADRRIYEPMNRWLFHTVEQGYAVDLFDRLTTGAHAVSDGEAAIIVRNTFGKYGDISATEQRLMVNRLFYFYPWMKTVIPFWTRKGLVDPKWVDAPMRAIEENNKQQGYDDPSKPFTATTGRRSDGTFSRYVVPLPQRVTEMVAQGARAPFDAARGDWEAAGADAAAPVDYVRGHLNTFAAVGADALDFVNARKGGHDAAPWNVFSTNKDDPAWKRGATVAGNVVGRGFAPAQQAGRIQRDPALGTFSTLFGGFPYSTKPEALRAREHSVRATFSPLLAAARKRGNAPLIHRLIRQEDDALVRVDNAYVRALGAEAGK